MNLKNLIENKLISFNSLMIQNYHELHLDETECMILLLLHNEYLKNKQVDIDYLVKKMSISKEKINEYLLLLMQKEVIEYINKENINFDNLYSMLTPYLENKEAKVDDVKVIVTYIQTTLQKPVLQNELVLIQGWLSDGFTVDEIKSAVLKALANHKTNLNYIDRILINSKQTTINQTIDPETAEILRNIHVK